MKGPYKSWGTFKPERARFKEKGRERRRLVAAARRQSSEKYKNTKKGGEGDEGNDRGQRKRPGFPSGKGGEKQRKGNGDMQGGSNNELARTVP